MNLPPLAEPTESDYQQLLHYLLHKPAIKEYSEELGIPRNTLRNNIRRALRNTLMVNGYIGEFPNNVLKITGTGTRMDGKDFRNLNNIQFNDIKVSQPVLRVLLVEEDQPLVVTEEEVVEDVTPVVEDTPQVDSTEPQDIIDVARNLRKLQVELNEEGIYFSWTLTPLHTTV